MANEIEFKDIKDNKEIVTYISQADSSLAKMGFTDHSVGHAMKTAKVTKDILSSFGYSKREINLGQIAAYMHDIGNSINRVNHGLVGANMAFTILRSMGMDPLDISIVISAIGNHDESASYPVNAVTAALIIADKTDVRRSRVRHAEADHSNDIHDRVNYAVIDSKVIVESKERTITLKLTIDTEITAIMDYFEIFLSRMKLCKLAAATLKANFKLVINDMALL